MSLRPCIAKVSFGLWATRQCIRPQVSLATRVERRSVAIGPLSVELKDIISPEVVRRLKVLRDDLKVAVGKKNVDDLCFNLTSSRRIFFSLPKLTWQHVRNNHLCLTRPELEEIAQVLVGRCKKGDAEALGQLLRDSQAMYGIEPTPDLLLSALNALARTGQQMAAYDLLMLFNNYKKKPFRLTSRHWRVTMWGLAQIGEVEKLKECLGIMKGSLPFPGNPHYHALLEGLLRRSEPPSTDEVYEVVDELQKFRIPYDGTIYGVLVRIANKCGFDSLPSEYQKACDSQMRSSDSQVEERLQQLISSRKKARVAFETKLNTFRHEGFVPDERTLRKLVQMSSLTSSDELIYLQETLELPANIITWSICLRSALDKSGWRGALSVYNAAKAQGIKPDAAMIHPLLRVMCSRFIREPPEPALDQALELYKDLDEDTRSTGRPGADTAVYNTLLRALAAGKNKQKYFPIALQLLEDMRSQGVYMDRMTATSVAVILVRSSSTYEEAAGAYKQIRKVNADGLDQKGFAAVLHAFCSLEPDAISSETNKSDSSASDKNVSGQPFPIPPAKLYFEILRDMYENGLRKTAEVYTILLGRYAALATRARNVRDPERREMIVHILRKVIKETHRQISVDAGLEPDAPLLNQLMDTYNRAGLFRDVMHVWTMLNSTGLVSPASVSIVFDTCGHHGQAEQADVIFCDLKERGYKFNRRNWNSWVECLCRLNRLDEAMEAVCSDMAGAESPEVRPDKQTVQMLLSFASAYGKLDEVRTHLKAHLPFL